MPAGKHTWFLLAKQEEKATQLYSKTIEIAIDDNSNNNWHA